MLSTWYFNPPVVEICWRWAFSTEQVPMKFISMKAGFLPNACKRWKNVPNSFPPVSLSFNEVLQVFDPTKFSNHALVSSSRIQNFQSDLSKLMLKKMVLFFSALTLSRKLAFIRLHQVWTTGGLKYQVLIQFCWVHMAKKVKFSFFSYCKIWALFKVKWALKSTNSLFSSS